MYKNVQVCFSSKETKMEAFKTFKMETSKKKKKKKKMKSLKTSSKQATTKLEFGHQ